MKKWIISLLLVCGAAVSAPAQRLQFGIHGGVNVTDYKFLPVTIEGMRFSPGPVRAGYKAGAVLRLNLSRRLHLQSEFDYTTVDYAVRTYRRWRHDVSVRAERFEIPVQLGLKLGVVRLFGGAVFRVAQTQRSSAPDVLRIGFNDDDVALTGGIGLNINHFFLDFRMTGFPRGRVWHTFVSQGVTERVKVPHDIVYGATIGFFF